MTDLATLGLAIDSSPAAHAASDLDRLTAAAVKTEKAVDATGQAASRAGKSLSGATSATKQAAASMEAVISANDNAVGAVNRHIAAIQRLTEAERRMSSAFGRGADIAAYGQELDRLRAKFNPTFAALQTYRSNLSDIRQAHSVGAISASEMASAISRERQATLASIAALKGRATSLRQVAVAERSAAAAANDNAQHVGGFQTANIAAQFQDIGVTAAMGMSPLQIALQQGTQLSSVLTSMQSPLKGLLTSFGSLFSLTSLGTIAMVAAGAAAIQWMMQAASSADKLDDRLENHSKAVEHLKKLYGDAADAADKLDSTGGKAFSRAIVGFDRSELQKQLDAEMKKARVATRGESGWLNSGLSFVGLGSDGGEKTYATLVKLPQQMEVYQGAVRKFLDTIRSGRPDLAGLSADLMKIYDAQSMAPGADANQLRTMVDVLDAMAQNAVKVSGEFEAFSTPINKMNINIAEGNFQMEETIKQVEAIGASNGMTEQADKLIKLLEPLVRVSDALREIKAAELEFSRANEGRGADRSLYQEAGKERRRINELQQAENERTAARIAGIKAVTDAEKVAAAAAQAGAGVTNSTERRILEENAAMQERARLEAEARQGARDRARDRAEALTQQQEELSLIGKTASEVARLQFEYAELAKLREESARTGRDIDQQEIDAIRQKSQEMGRYAEQVAAARAMDDIMFERAQMGRPREEQQVYSEIRRLGLDINSSDGKRVADAIRINQELEKQQQAATALAGIFSDLFSRPIKDADEFFDRVMSGFAKIGQANLDKAFESLFGGGKAGSSKGATSAVSGDFLSQIGDWLGGLFTSNKVVSAQNKAIDTAAAKIPAEPLVTAMSTVGGAVSNTTSKVSTSLTAYASAIKKIESGGNYQALGPVTKSGDRAYGAYQVMGNNIPSWTKQLLGYAVSTQDFLRDNQLQDRVFYQQFGKSLDRFGNFSDAAAVWFSGQPLSVSKSRSDGYNTTEQYVSKATKALSGVKVEVAQGAKTGIEEGIKTVATSNLSATPNPQSATGQAATGGQSLGDVLGAALGGLGMGFQAQDPIMGGLGGAISGFASGGIPGALIGGIAGIFGGIFGRSKAKKAQQRQEQMQAKAELEKNKSVIAQMFAAGSGMGTGEVTTSVLDFQDTTTQLSELALKARDPELLLRLQDNFNKFFLIVEKDFVDVLPGMMDAYASGFGSDSPFAQAQVEVGKLRDELKNFVADARSFGELQLQHNRALTPQGLEDRVREAERAAQQTALATLTGTKQLSAMEEEMLRLDGSSSKLEQTLRELGMSAEESARSVEAGMQVAIAKLKDAFTLDLNASINELSGVGYLNEIADAQAKYQDRRKDAAALGIDGSLALRELSLTIKDIVSSAGVSKEEIALLSQAFPELSFILADTGNSATNLATATSQLQSAYDAESNSLNELISRTKSFVTSIKQFREQMKINDSSPLGPKERVEEAARQFRELAAKANAGDEDAMNQLTQVSQAYLDEARSYYASSEAYFAIWKEVDATLGDTQSISQRTLSNAEAQLSALDASVAGILTVNESVLSVRDALDAYAKANGTNVDALKTQLGIKNQTGQNSIQAAYRNYLNRDADSSELSYWQGRVNSGTSIDNVVAEIGGSREAEINRLYKQILGTRPDLATVKSLFSSDQSLSQIEGSFVWQKWVKELEATYQRVLGFSPDDQAKLYWRATGKSMAQIEDYLNGTKAPATKVAAFATGGLHAGGLRLVGENGPEIEATGPSRIWNASQTRAMLQPSGGDSQIAAEIRGLREDNAALRAEVRSLKQAVAYAGAQQIAEQQKTNENLADVGGELKRANASR